MIRITLLSFFCFLIVSLASAQCKGKEEAAFMARLDNLFHGKLSMYGPVNPAWKKDSTMRSKECKGEVLYRYRFNGELYRYIAEYTVYAKHDTIQLFHVRIINIDSISSLALRAKIVNDLGELQVFTLYKNQYEIYNFSDCRSACNSVYYYIDRKEWILQYGSHKFNWCFTEF
jgi:hypothetical protein